MDIPSIVQAYAHGYFLMTDDEGKLGWYSSRNHALIPLDNRFHRPKSLQRVLNQNRFSVAINRDFLGVCRGCADRETTWISEELINVYLQLNKAGWAHSFETWQEDKLAGGIIGMAIRGAFIGESMFYSIPDASKVAMVRLVEHLRKQKFILFDAQIQNPHLARFGAYSINDREYKSLLNKALSHPCSFL